MRQRPETLDHRKGDDHDTTSSTTATTKGASAAAKPVVDPGDGGSYDPKIDPANFATTIDNPYLPLLPGGRWSYEGTSDGKPETIEISVLEDKKTVMGVPVVVVRDTVTIDGELVEDTLDWFAQDDDGSVWYFGEEVKDYENGKVVSTAGSTETEVGDEESLYEVEVRLPDGSSMDVQLDEQFKVVGEKVDDDRSEGGND